MNHRIGLFIFCFALLFVLAGCGEKPECEISTDCRDKVCATTACVNNKCVYNEQKNCCGNGIKETLEDGLVGSECTCPKDYGTCEGVAQITSGRRPVDATYVKQFCNQQQECVLGVDPDDVKEVSLVQDLNFPGFRVELIPSYNQPFRVPTDSFAFKIVLKDVDDDIVLPIKFTNMKLTEGSVLLGQQPLSSVLAGVGDEDFFRIPATFTMSDVELQKTVSYALDYEFVTRKEKRQRNGSITTEDILTRDTYDTRLASRLIFAQDE